MESAGFKICTSTSQHPPRKVSGPHLGNGDNDWTHSLIGLKDIKHLARERPVHGSYYCYYELSLRKDFQPLEVSINGARGRGEEISLSLWWRSSWRQSAGWNSVEERAFGEETLKD